MIREHGRIDYFDIAKGIAILAVVLGHMGWSAVNPFIYSFHMPLFFMISGYFISEKTQGWALIRRKARQLLLPYYMVALLFIILSAGLMLLQDGYLPAKGVVKRELISYIYANTFYCSNWGIKPMAGIWFFWALFVASIIVSFIKNWAVDKSFFFLGVLAVAGYLASPRIALPFCFDLAAVGAFFVYLGYVAKKYRLLNNLLSCYVLTICVVLWGCSIEMGGDLYLVNNHIGQGLYSVVGAVAGCIVILRISKALENIAMVSTFLRFLGKQSLLIYAIHFLELSFIPWGRLDYFCENTFWTYISLFGVKVILILSVLALYLKCKSLIVSRVMKCKMS